ncbi:MAG TPA: hypothetical protein VNR89_22820 [Roseomonas sp.]|nr:hypothetical protein [Roseomonas sp.]
MPQQALVMQDRMPCFASPDRSRKLSVHAGMVVRENIAQDVLGTRATMQGSRSEAWIGRTVQANASLRCRMMVRQAEASIHTQSGVSGFFNQQFETKALHDLAEDASAIICGGPSMRAGAWQTATETSGYARLEAPQNVT